MSKAHWIDKFLPPMQCDKGCGECCGVAPCSEGEFQRAVRYAREHGIEPRRNGVTCPFYQEGECAIHEARPAVCRLFGHSPLLVCHRGYNVNIMASAEVAIFKRMRSEASGGMRLLHEAIYTLPEMVEVVNERLQHATPLTVNGKDIGREPDPKTYHAAKSLQEMFGVRMAGCFADTKEFPLV